MNTKSLQFTPRLVSRFLVNHDHRLLYCPIEKNSCTYFKRLLLEHGSHREEFLASRMDPHRYIKAADWLRLSDASPFVDPSYLRFVILREPVGRMVSAYLNRFVSNIKFPGAIELTKEYRERHNLDLANPQLLTFTEFVESLVETEDKHLDPHFRSQWFYCEREINYLDWKVTLERIPEFLEVLSQRIGVEIVDEKTKNRTKYGEHSIEEKLFDQTPGQLRRLSSMPTKEALVTEPLREKLINRFAPDVKLYADAVNAKWPVLKN